MREKEVKQLLQANNKTWEDFLKFMRGQTVFMYEDGDTNYYDCDVEMFINHGKIKWSDVF